jgi:hypothetical protein
MPEMIVIGTPEETNTPIPFVNYSAGMLEALKKVDFDKSFVLIHLVGQIPDNGIINNVVRKGDTVHIVLKSYSVGPGNYELPGYTLPYQLTAITKSDTRSKEIEFILKVEGGDILAKKGHFIP